MTIKSARQSKRFVDSVVMPWLAQRPERMPAAGALYQHFRESAATRASAEKAHGVSVPSTLMIAINSYCNLRCPTCTVGETVPLPNHQLSHAQLDAIFAQCRTLGISNFVLLGGEPLLYEGLEDVIASQPDCLFNVFSNGRLLKDDKARQLSRLKNLAMFINAGSTNRKGTVAQVDRGILRAMQVAESHGLLFGYSTTISDDNVHLFSRTETLEQLSDHGARFALFMDYLPQIGIQQDRYCTRAEDRDRLVACAERFAVERDFFVRLVPEDESLFGGCMAAGRVFLFISAYGTVDPCPFVPWSNAHIDEVSLLQVLQSNFMRDMRSRSRDWEMRGGSCAVRTAAAEFAEVASQNETRPNVAWRNDAPVTTSLNRLRRAQ